MQGNEPTEEEKKKLEAINLHGEITPDQVLDIFDMESPNEDKPAVALSASGSIDPPEGGPQPSGTPSKSDDEVVDDLLDQEPEEEPKEEPEEEPEGEPKEEPEEEPEDGDKDEEEGPDLLDILPEDLRGEDEEETLRNFFQRYAELETQAKGPAKEETEDDVLKEQNRLAQELAEAKKIIARQNQLMGSPQDAITAPPALMPEVSEADLDVDFAKIGDLAGQEFEHDLFEAPDEAMSERLGAFGKKLAEVLNKQQASLVQRSVAGILAEQERRREFTDFRGKHPDFEGLRDEMLEVIQRNPMLDTKPGSLEIIYDQAKQLQERKFSDLRDRLGLESMPGTPTPKKTEKVETPTKPTKEPGDDPVIDADKLVKMFLNRRRAKKITSQAAASKNKPPTTKRGKKPPKKSVEERVVDEMLAAGGGATPDAAEFMRLTSTPAVERKR